ncbi:nuclear transport factor 2 family protein [Sphingobium chungbukense]|nr:nuclear transport factor 2 family protein [Sphingobium chungbukense]
MNRRSALLATGMLGAAAAVPGLAQAKGSVARPLTVEDRIGLQDLHTEYVWAYDCSDEQGFIDLFAKDGMVIGHGTWHRDEAAMRKWFRYLLDIRDKADDYWLHEASQFRFEGDGGNCIVYCYATHFRGTPASKPYPAEVTMGVRSLGYFVNDCVKEDGRWKFRRFTINRWDNHAQPWKKPRPWDLPPRA